MKPTPQAYSLYGMQVHSEIPLPAAPDQNDLPPDLRVQWSGYKPITTTPEGEILSQLLLPDGRGYTLVDTGKNYVLHFHHTGEFAISRYLRRVCVHLAPAVDPDIAGLLVVGNIMACFFTLSGEPVLHASAVAFDGKALAFLGSSGMGKSSLAGLLCAHGASFITDDLLRLQPDGDGWCCFPGTGVLRLRQNAAASMRENFSSENLEATADERVAIRFDGGPKMPKLNAIIIPRLSRVHPTLELEHIPPAKALLYLAAFPRIQESSRRKHRQSHLDFLGRIAASVPLYEAIIPWGLPYPDDLAPSLLSVLRAHLAPRTDGEDDFDAI